MNIPDEKSKWTIDGLREIDIEYLLERLGDDESKAITETDIVDTLIN